jgi:uncharacterized protein
MRYLGAKAAATIVAAIAFTIPDAKALSPQPAPHEQTKAPSYHYPRLFGYIAMHDGTKLAYVAYLPRRQGRFPAILEYGPYVNGGEGPSIQFLQDGYAYVSVNVRGTGCSQGNFGFLSEQEGMDGKEVINWISHQAWSNQAVGMWGYSMPGHTAILVAAQHPTALKAIVAGDVTESLYWGMLYPGGIFNVAFASRWAKMLQPMIAELGQRARIQWGDTDCNKNVAERSKSKLFEEIIQHPHYDKWWKSKSLATYVQSVSVPTLIVHAWEDHETQFGDDLYSGLRGRKALLLMPGGHFTPADINQIQSIRWFDRWVKGVHNGIEREPPVDVLWELHGQPLTPGWTTTYNHWPVHRAKLRLLYLLGNGALSSTPPTSQNRPVDRSYTFPTGTELVGDNAQFAIPPDPSGVLYYSTVALSQDLTILGHPKITVYVSSERKDTDFMIVLHDVYPNGDVQYLQRTFLRASLRDTAPQGPMSNLFWRSYEAADDLIPGKVYKIAITLPSLGAVIRKGHRLELGIMSPNPIGQPDWGLLPLALPGRNTVYSSPEYPSELAIPVLSGVRSEAPSLPCGTIPFQPCRAANTWDPTMLAMPPSVRKRIAAQEGRQP